MSNSSKAPIYCIQREGDKYQIMVWKETRFLFWSSRKWVSADPHGQATGYFNSTPCHPFNTYSGALYQVEIWLDVHKPILVEWPDRQSQAA